MNGIGVKRGCDLWVARYEDRRKSSGTCQSGLLEFSAVAAAHLACILTGLLGLSAQTAWGRAAFEQRHLGVPWQPELAPGKELRDTATPAHAP